METVAGTGDPGAADDRRSAGAAGVDAPSDWYGSSTAVVDVPVPETVETDAPPGPSLLAGREPIVPPRTAEWLTKAVGAAAVAGATIFVVWQLRLGLIFSSNMDVGGDNGGHVAGPYFLIHHLLVHGRLTGWDPWWSDGMPLYVFYFPLPALLVAALDVVLPYNQAFNVVTILGTVLLPVCAWAFGALAGFRRPVPVLMSLMTLPFIFNTSYTIDGGNLTSTLAGEFSFSLSVSIGLLFLGVFCRSLRTGRLRWLAAALFAVTVLCHLVPALAFACVAALMALSRLRLRSLRIAAGIGVVGALLAAFWLVPFAADLQYSSSMGYLPVGGLHAPLDPRGFVYVLVPAVLGAIIALGRRDGFAIAIALAALGAALAFWKMPSGLVYNGRWLPFWFLFVGLMAAYGVGEAIRALGRLLRLPRVAATVGTAGAFVACTAGAAYAGGLVGAFPGIAPQGNHIQVQGWVQWNYTGFQGKSGWPQFAGLVRMLDRAGHRYGCGRLQYEYISETTNPFGSTEAMMSLPMWTGGCIGLTDGIYFESSTTTPYHFLDVNEVSQQGEAPNPVSYLNYPGFNVADGVRHLQLMGVRYFLAMSPTVQAQASVDPFLQKIGQVKGFGGTINGAADDNPVWQLYLVRDAPLVVPLTHLPVVEPSTAHQWLDTTLAWYEKSTDWPVELARAGPASWPHANPGTLEPPQLGVPVTPTVVSGVHTTDSSVSFHVSSLGRPVLVKIPYFPNWQATGANGPYEAAPNVMVVVPTSHEVTLAYGTSPADWVGKAGSLAGLVGLGVLAFTKAPDPGADRPAPASEPAQPVGGMPSLPTGDDPFADDLPGDDSFGDNLPADDSLGDDPLGADSLGDRRDDHPARGRDGPSGSGGAEGGSE